MRPVEKIRRLSGILKPQDVTTVVDVGANPFAGTPPYGTLRRSDCCQVIGFEPLPEALAALTENARSNDTFLPYAVGDGTRQKLFVTRNSGLVSTLRPLKGIGDLLGPWWQRATQIKSETDIETRRLDDIDEVPRIDFLKIDIQGGELKVFENARGKLKHCAAIQTELCLHPYYEDQPSFGDVQAELTAQGFIAHKFVETSAHPIAHDIAIGEGAKAPRSQITVADMVFIRNPSRINEMDAEIIKHMAQLSFSVFGSFDLTLRCLSELLRRDKVDASDIAEAVRLMGLT